MAKDYGAPYGERPEKDPAPQVYRVEARVTVKVVFDVVAFSEKEAEELAAGQPTSVHTRAITLAVEAGEFDVNADTVQVEDLGEASDADVARPHQVMAIRP